MGVPLLNLGTLKLRLRINEAESAEIFDLREKSRLISFTESPRDNRFMKDEMNATIGEPFDLRDVEANAAAASPASSEVLALFV